MISIEFKIQRRNSDSDVAGCLNDFVLCVRLNVNQDRLCLCVKLASKLELIKFFLYTENGMCEHRQTIGNWHFVCDND
jgi:hypothetical protein